jgi:hypothetical protein
MYRQIILGVGQHIVAIFKKAGEPQFKIAVADDAIEDALLRDEITLVL